MLLTSNNTRELTEALKRRCLYLWLDYPPVEQELAIVRLHTPDLSEQVARKLVEVVAMVRELDLKKPPSIAESIDWARALLLLGADDIDAPGVQGDDVGDRQAPHRPGHRRRARRRQARWAALAPRLPEPGPPGISARLIELGEELRAEGVAVGTSELLDAFDALAEVPWTVPEDFREALAATLAKSPEDRRVFELVFERFFFRAAEIAAVHAGIREQDGGAPASRASPAPGEGEGSGEGGDIDLDALREAIARAIQDGDEGALRDLARLAIAAFGRQGTGSGVIGVDVQRIRRSLGLRAEPQPELPEDDPRRDGLPRERLRRFEQLLRRELERGQIERTKSMPAARPLNELDRSLPSGPAAGSRRGAPGRRPAAPAAGHPGQRAARPPAQQRRRRAPHDARLAADRRRARRAALPPAPAAPPGDLRAVRRLHERHQRQRLLPAACCTRCTTRFARCARSCSSSASAR